MVAACLYFSIRKARIPTTLNEILEETSETAKNVRRCYRALIRELNLKTPNTDPSSLIPKYIAQLGLDKEIGSLSTKILTAYTSKFPISGKDPKGYCAGAIYLACRIRNINLTQKEIIHIVGVTEVTLRSRYKELRTKLNIKVQ
jgi:transcription initiation factor TFIIB